jgi:hypothetical protein
MRIPFTLSYMQRVATCSVRRITNYGIYRHDVKVEHPPRQQPRIWRLPVHRKLIYVSQGWFYRKKGEETVRTTTSCISFVKSASHKLIESLTKEEFNFLIENKAKILAEFDRVAQKRADMELDDLKREHVCQ